MLLGCFIHSFIYFWKNAAGSSSATPSHGVKSLTYMGAVAHAAKISALFMQLEPTGTKCKKPACFYCDAEALWTLPLIPI